MDTVILHRCTSPCTTEVPGYTSSQSLLRVETDLESVLRDESTLTTAQLESPDSYSLPISVIESYFVRND